MVIEINLHQCIKAVGLMTEKGTESPNLAKTRTCPQCFDILEDETPALKPPACNHALCRKCRQKFDVPPPPPFTGPLR